MPPISLLFLYSGKRMEQIHITLPDGSVKDVPKGTTPADVARSISPRLADAALVARVAAPNDGEGELVDLRRPLDRDVKLQILTEKDPDSLFVFRHSAAHLLAAAVMELYPNVKLGIGPPIDTGFFYEFLRQEPKPQLQRIYAVAFFTQKELDEHLHRIEEAKRRDHRKLGVELDLFSIQEEAGPGLIFWHPKGGLIRKIVEDWLREELLKRGYDLVYTPHIMRLDLWKTSGHTNFYRDNMFGAVEVEKADYQLKPMNCPGHILIYKSKLRSYRDLPVRLAELGTVYRYERSGVLHGLLRVRGFTQDDAHIFCMPSQIESEVEACVDFAFAVMKNFGFDKFEVELSDWDPGHPENYAGKPADWHRATAALADTMKRMNIPYKKMAAEAAFYGPKIDDKLIDAIRRSWQLNTVTIDFNLPARFGLQYAADDGAKHQPLMVHRALLGSVERFFGILIEHYAGAFPLWLAPVQVEVCPVSEKVADYSKHVTETLKRHSLRVHLDDRNEKLPAKIRDAQLQKIPYMLVVGPKETEAGTVSVRHRSKGDLGPKPLAEVVESLRQEVDSRATS